MNKTQQRVIKVLERMIKLIEDDDDYADMFYEIFHEEVSTELPSKVVFDFDKKLCGVFEGMIKMSKEFEEYAEDYSHTLDLGLEELHGNDAFGSEGQADPRGDGRNGEFSMDYVEGVDDI